MKLDFIQVDRRESQVASLRSPYLARIFPVHVENCENSPSPREKKIIFDFDQLLPRDPYLSLLFFSRRPHAILLSSRMLSVDHHNFDTQQLLPHC